MVAGSDTQSSPEVVENCPSSSDCPQLCIECSDDATDGYDQDEGCVDPVDMLVPVTECDGLFADMLPSTTWLSFGHSGRRFENCRFLASVYEILGMELMASGKCFKLRCLNLRTLYRIKNFLGISY